MADVPPATTPAPPEQPEARESLNLPPDPSPKADQTVPYDRFKQVNDEAKAAKEQLKSLEQRLQEIEDKDKSELERERAQRERLQTELQEREARLTRVERGQWVREAAAEAKFIDPTDALGRVDLSQIESEADAKREVKKIADKAKHLVQAEPEPPPVPGRVLANGQPADPNAPDPRQEENEKFLAELKAKSAEGWTSSSVGILD